jgi:hypothetical protein
MTPRMMITTICVRSKMSTMGIIKDSENALQGCG